MNETLQAQNGRGRGRTIIGAAAAALAAGLLLPTPSVTAAPLNCADYVYPGSFEIMQDNNILTAINNNGNRFDGGGASYKQVGAAGGDTRGISTGSRNGRNIDITVNWNNGFSSHITGYVADDLVGRGTTVNNQGVTNTWYSLNKFTCVAPPVAAPAPKAEEKVPVNDPDPVASTATVTQESTVYDAPDGRGTPYKDDDGNDIFLSPGKVTLVEPCRSEWCHVVTNKVPGGKGWIYQTDFVTVP